MKVGDLRHPATVKASVTARMEGTAGAHLWRRLNAIDFLNRGILFASVLLLSLVPFLLVLRQLSGRDSASDLVARFGLDDQAAAAVRDALTSPRSASATLSGVSWVLLVVGGLSSATAIQELYEHVFDAPHRGVGGMPRRVAWLVALVVVGSAVNAVQPWLYDVGGLPLLALTSLVGATLFWWFSMWLLLAGHLGWLDLLPAAVATGVCWLGMTIAFRLTMSETITSDYEKYGAIGVVFALMTFLIAVGVVLIVGAVFGAVWRERRAAGPS